MLEMSDTITLSRGLYALEHENKLQELCNRINKTADITSFRPMKAVELVCSEQKAQELNNLALQDPRLGRNSRQLDVVLESPNTISSYLLPRPVVIRKYCRVMTLEANYTAGYSAGQLGTVTGPGNDKRRVKVLLDTGMQVYVEDHHIIHNDSNSYKNFRQIPLDLAYARSINKLREEGLHLVLPEVYIDPDNFMGTAKQYCYALQFVQRPIGISLKRRLRITDFR